MTTTIGIDIRVLGTGRTSGVEEYTGQLLAHMIPLDPAVRYKLFYAGRHELEHQLWMSAPNVTLYRSWIPNRLLWAGARLAGRPYLDRLVGGADVFFFPHFLVGATSPDCRRVLTIHDLSFERFPELFSLGRRMWHQVQMRPRVQAHAADRIIAVSDSTRDDLIELYGIHPDKISTVHSGIDAGMTRPDAAELERFRAAHRLPERFVLMLGTLEPRKNIEGVIAAFERLGGTFSDVELVIVGPKGWLWRGVIERVNHSSRRSRIRFVDSVTPADLPLWLGAASVLVYPSLLEGFGFPPLQALACGTPALVGANSSMLQVCGGAVPVDPYSVTQIATGLATLLGDTRLREQVVARGQAATSFLSWDRTASLTLEHLFSTLDPRR